MYWRLQIEALPGDLGKRGFPPGSGADLSAGEGSTGPQWGNRFVLHRHHDRYGEHLDLRLEAEGFLMGWRIDGGLFDGACWASEKSPHPVSWLDHPGPAVVLDTGIYHRQDERDRRTIILKGGNGYTRIQGNRVQGLPAEVIRDIQRAIEESRAEGSDAAQLIRDGLASRNRAVARFCGLGRELDGSAFDEGSWRSILGRLPLDAIYGQLRALEVRFDRKYPPSPTSCPEPLERERAGADAVMAILKE